MSTRRTGPQASVLAEFQRLHALGYRARAIAEFTGIARSTAHGWIKQLDAGQVITHRQKPETFERARERIDRNPVAMAAINNQWVPVRPLTARDRSRLGTWGAAVRRYRETGDTKHLRDASKIKQIETADYGTITLPSEPQTVRSMDDAGLLQIDTLFEYPAGAT